VGVALLYHGDSLDVLKQIDDSTIDSIVTDPPYGLAFMSKKWDYDIPSVDIWKEVFRVLKPGGHLLSFAGTRTYHRMVVNIEDAGFEIRDQIGWLFGSGFPKSHSVAKAILPKVELRYGKQKCDCVDSSDGCALGQDVGREDREDVRVQRTASEPSPTHFENTTVSLDSDGCADSLRGVRHTDSEKEAGSSSIQKTVLLQAMRERGPEAPGHGHAPIRRGMEEPPSGNPSARQGVPVLRDDAEGEWRGAPSPSSEAVPLRGHESAKQPCGALRDVPPQDRCGDGTSFILDPDRRDARRIVADDQCGWDAAVAHVCSWCGLPAQEWIDSFAPLGTALKPAWEPICLARKPLIGTVVENILEHGTGGINIDDCRVPTSQDDDIHAKNPHTLGGFGHADASIYGTSDGAPAYDPSVGRFPANIIHDGSEEVLEAFPASTGTAARFFYSAKASKKDRAGSKHPTVKPISLMKYLCRLITPPGGMILDPFAGSGSTGQAAIEEGFDIMLIEREAEYIDHIKERFRFIDQIFTLIEMTETAEKTE
jgi:DNA modification methylase